MKKTLASMVMLFVFLHIAVSGDVAAFYDMGFSTDSGTYVFGQYGRTDKDFHGYAEIYVVDVAKNDFVADGVFCSTDKTGKSGIEVFKQLKDNKKNFLSKYGVKPVPPENVLYVRGGTDVDAAKKIVFKDFENSTEQEQVYYNIQLVPMYEGKGSNTKSSFYIIMERKDANGKMLSRQVVGNPDIKRKGVTGYTIDKIFTNQEGTGIVFLVEKTIADKTGVSIRYMVETANLLEIEKNESPKENGSIIKSVKKVQKEEEPSVLVEK